MLTGDNRNYVRRDCPACRSDKGWPFGEKNGYALDICGACGTVYVRQTECVPFDYDGYYDESNLSVPEFIAARLDAIFASFASHRRTNRMLDVGCGAGTILQAARRAGWAAEGLDISRPAAEHMRVAGFEVFCGELAEARYPDAHFDLVTACEVIEHLADPATLIEEIARILRPGGLLWATTPHVRGLSARALGLGWSTICPPEHLQLFSLRGARLIAKRASFRRVRVTSRGCNPIEIWRAISRRSKRAGAHAASAESVAIAESSGVQESASSESFDRVAAGYRLNEALLRNSTTRAVKAAANAMLGATRLGDSIRIWAEK